MTLLVLSGMTEAFSKRPLSLEASPERFVNHVESALFQRGVAAASARSLPRLRGRAGERVSPQWDNPQEEKALTRIASRSDLSRKRER
ncbi:hypothetical protein XH98_17650 [Bradyrhizobium sp. CCBAU 51745]|nr:hypothetical protein [Bradyrhizobium sp. CCBAU 51745]